MASPQIIPELFVPGSEFTHAELSAMVLDGVLCPVYGNAYRSSSASNTPALRANALMSQVPASAASKSALSRHCAAWVYGVAPPPRIIDVNVDSAQRCGAISASTGVVIHEVKLGRFDVQRIAGMQITSPLRTAVDIACYALPMDAQAILLAFDSSAEFPCPLQSVLHALEVSAHFRGRRKGLNLLENMSKN